MLNIRPSSSAPHSFTLVASRPPSLRLLVAHALRTDAQDNGPLLTSIAQRLQRVGMARPTVEVRFKDLAVKANVTIGSRSMPNVLNFFRSKFEALIYATRLCVACPLGLQAIVPKPHPTIVTVPRKLLCSNALACRACSCSEPSLTLSGPPRSRRVRPETQELQVLERVSGVLRPGRLTLLLGPPSSVRAKPAR